MSKHFLLLALVTGSFSLSVSGQTFISQQSANGDPSSGSGMGAFNVYNGIRATSSPVVVRWRIIGTSPNLTAAATEWGTDGFCDNVVCYAGGASLLGGQLHTTDVITSSNFATFYALLNATNAPNNSTAWMRLEVKDTASGGTVRNLTFIGTKSSTGTVNTAVSDDGLILFPNPATSQLSVAVTDGSSVRTLSVYSADGKQILAQQLVSSTATLSLEGVAAGTYFINFKDADGRTIATRSFVRK